MFESLNTCMTTKRRGITSTAIVVGSRSEEWICPRHEESSKDVIARSAFTD